MNEKKGSNIIDISAYCLQGRHYHEQERLNLYLDNLSNTEFSDDDNLQIVFDIKDLDPRELCEVISLEEYRQMKLLGEKMELYISNKNRSLD